MSLVCGHNVTQPKKNIIQVSDQVKRSGKKAQRDATANVLIHCGNKYVCKSVQSISPDMGTFAGNSV